MFLLQTPSCVFSFTIRFTQKFRQYECDSETMAGDVLPASCWQIEFESEFCQRDADGTLRGPGKTNHCF
jgi:hypothetical protein